MIKKLNLLLIPASALIVASCGGDKSHEENDAKGYGIDITSIDSTVRPQDDFYDYANNNWLKRTEIPASEARWGSFSVLNETNKKNLMEILEGSAKDTKAAKGSNVQKIGDFYYTSMDSVKLNAEGIAPIKPLLDEIDKMSKPEDLTLMAAKMHRNMGGVLWGAYVMADIKNSAMNTMYIGQSGISLPDCDYYLKSDPESKELQKQYVNQISKMLQFLGDKPEIADKEALAVMKIETQLAKASMNAVAQRDIAAQYNKKTLDELSKDAPNVNWKAYFEALGVHNLADVVVSQPKFMMEVSKMYKSVSMSDWKTYFRWHLIDEASGFLSDEIVMQNFDFFEKTLNGSKQLKPRWKRSLEIIDATMGEALGQIYVEKHFSADSKKRINEMVDNLTAAYSDHINQLDWMSEETKKMAQVKLKAIIRKLGYPDKWKDYSKLEITRESYFKNVVNAAEFAFQFNIDKMGKPVDKTEWGMSPPTVNAYYNPTVNEIVFPAGIMQPPFFDPKADDAVNYARIGAVIGHEITHGFDDQGAQFDAEGNLKNWWSKDDSIKFKEKTKVVINQFNGFVAIDTLHVIGELTVGENIADLGGFTIAFAALQKSWAGKTKPGKIDGFTPEQRFFLAGAQMWQTKYRDEALKKQVLTNPHAPGKFRVIGPFSNMPEFYAAFGVKEGDKMYRPESIRAKIW
ncbi:MAG TPA: M13 family metallopeptidase [Bacteroidia bacterium]|nr:M13 family metallopeptidase [Bacteroidia bacterium]